MSFDPTPEDLCTVDFDGLSLNNQAADYQDVDVCDRCQAVCRKPDERSARWKFLFRITETPDDLAALRCEICHFFKEVMHEHQKLSTDKLPPPFVSICARQGSNPSHNCLLKITYKLSHRYQIYYVKVAHLASLHNGQFATRAHPTRIPYEKIKVWINRCQDHDPHKLASDKHIKHLKVIDCNTDPISIVVAPESCQYVALSYVWGESQEASPQEADTLGEYMPQTIRDSIKVTLELGYQYLWVDRYCIDQHDQFDKSHQIGQMGAIYARAQLTIFAVAGINSSHGLPGVGIGRRPPFSDVLAGTTYLRHDWDSTEDILSSKWVSRGWTLQESYLSTKRLFFTERQVIFVCNTEILCEHAPIEGKAYRLNDILKPASDSQSLALIMLIETYSKRQLRYQGDALNAISAILNAMTGPRTRYAHFWGVFINRGTYRRNVPVDDSNTLLMAWGAQTPGVRRKEFPSWSPLGWKAHVWFDTLHMNHTHGLQVWTGCEWEEISTLNKNKIEDLRLTPSSNSRFLRVTALAFRPHLFWATVAEQIVREPQLICSSGVDDLIFEPRWDVPPTDIILDKNVLCAVLIGRNSALFLLLRKPSHDLPSHSRPPLAEDLPVYERVGIGIASKESYYININITYWFNTGAQFRQHTYKPIKIVDTLKSEYYHQAYGNLRAPDCGTFEGHMQTFILA